MTQVKPQQLKTCVKVDIKEELRESKEKGVSI